MPKRTDGKRLTKAERANDPLVQDELRHRAAKAIRHFGWKLGDRFNLTAMLGLMQHAATDAIKNPPFPCAYPECGCDYDAVCDFSVLERTDAGRAALKTGASE